MTDKTVTLIHPDGRPYDATTPSEVYQLTAQGYSVKGKMTVDEAAASVHPDAKSGAKATPPATRTTNKTTDTP
jgi:hypothetical protein